MKINKKCLNILSIFVIVAYLITSGSAFAIENNTKTTKQNAKSTTAKTTTAQTTQTAKATKTKTKKSDKNAQQKVVYDNSFHSAFTLNDCLRIAAENNPQIQSAIYNEIASKTKIGQAWANYFPRLNAGVNGALQGSSSNRAMYNSETYKGFLANVSGDMLLFDFGKTKATADSAKRTYESKQQDTKESINTVVYDIKSTYYNVLFAEAQVHVYEDTVKDYELQLKQAEGFYGIGKKAKIDVVTADYNLGNARLNLVKARNTLKLLRTELSKVMGIPEYSNYELTDNLGIKRYEIALEDALKLALDVRPDVISAKKAMEAAKLNVRAAVRNYTPDISLTGGYNFYSEHSTSSADIGVGLNYSNFNILKTKKQIDEARALYKKSSADFDEVKNTVYMNVKKGHIDMETSIEAVKIATLSLALAKEQYRQATGRYAAGIGDAIELKDGENTYLNARLDFYNNLLDYNLAAAKLEKEIGTPLQPSDKYIIGPDKIKPYLQ